MIVHITSHPCSDHRRTARPTPARGTPIASLVSAFAALALLTLSTAHAQRLDNPVYFDESPFPNEALVRVGEFVRAGNMPEAARVLQLVLDRHAHQVTPDPDDPDIRVSVRDRVHAELLASPELLEQYRLSAEPRAAELLAAGELQQAVRSALLTPSGYESALRLAQLHMESASFDAALEVLRDLEDHPERSPIDTATKAAPKAAPKAAQDAAELLALLARYINRDQVWQMSERWLEDAGMDQRERAPIDPPDRVGEPSLSPLEQQGPFRSNELVSLPLRTVVLDETPTPMTTPARRSNRADERPPNMRRLGSVPTIWRDLVLVNTMDALSAWDRYTLAHRWEVSAHDAMLPDNARPFGRSVNEPRLSTVTVHDGTAFAVLAQRQGGITLESVIAVDAVTGRVLWTVPFSALDGFASRAAAGPLHAHEDTVILELRNEAARQRVVSRTLVGIDARTGAVRWERTLASAGSTARVRTAIDRNAGTLREAVFYAIDEIGVLGAFDVHTGEPRWIRRLPPGPTNVFRDDSPAFSTSTPVFLGDTLYVLAPDKESVLLFDPDTAEQIQSFDLGRGPNTPIYLVALGHGVVVVYEEALVYIPQDAADEGEISLISHARFRSSGILGRVCAVGDELMVPMPTGVAFLDPRTPDRDARIIPLDSPGNMLAADEQLLVVDDSNLHSYLLWDVARRLLNERMQADPLDVTTPLTLAGLAYRAGHEDHILFPVERAIEALEANPDTPDTRALRQRLYNEMHSMLLATLEPAPLGEEPPKRIEDTRVVESLINGLSQIARTPSQRLGLSLIAARDHIIRDRPFQALLEYQRVLDSAELRRTVWNGLSRSATGAAEVSRRTLELIDRHGNTHYAAQARSAEQLLEQTDPDDTRALGSIIERYPAAPVVPRVWLALSRAHDRDNKPARATDDARNGLAASARATDPDPQTLGELLGRVLEPLDRRGQHAAMLRALDTLAGRGDLALAFRGEQTTVAKVRALVRANADTTARHPRAGTPRTEGSHVFPGWSILPPIIAPMHPTHAESLVLTDQTASEVMLVTLDRDDGTPGPRTTYERRLDNGRCILLTHDQRRALFMLIDSESIRVEHVDTATGQLRWTSAPIDTLLSIDADQRMHRTLRSTRPDLFVTPIDGFVAPGDLLVDADERTITIVGRAGDAVALDANTGKVLWADNISCQRVTDIDIQDNTLVVLGQHNASPGLSASGGLSTCIVEIDARTGGFRQRVMLPGGAPRWVRLAPDRRALVGVKTGVHAYNLPRARLSWSTSDPRFAQTADAWLLPGRLLVLTSESQLVPIDLHSGTPTVPELASAQTHAETAEQIRVRLTDNSSAPGFAVCSTQGLVLYDADDRYTGSDALGGFDSLLPPVPTRDGFLTLDTISTGRTQDQLLIYNLHTLHPVLGTLERTDRILLGARPNSLLALDGAIAVTAGTTTVLYNAPPED